MDNFDRRGDHAMQEGLINRAYELARKKLEEGRVKIADFRSIYGESKIAQDTSYVREMEARFAEKAQEAPPYQIEAQKMGTILEAIMDDQIEMSDWLGPDVYTHPTSKLDDIKHGVDTVLEIEREEGAAFLALGIDVTHSAQFVPEKLKKIKSEIKRGEMATVEYFESETQSIKGVMENLPRVVVCVDKETLLKLVRAWTDRTKKKDMGEHPVQLQIIDEIIMQLETYRDYANNLKHTKLVQKYERQIKIFHGIRDQKKSLYKKLKVGENYRTTDQAYQSLERSLENFYSL